MNKQITISVTDDEARRIDELVTAGDIASPEELVRAALAFFLIGDEPDWMPPDDALRRLVAESVNDPRPSLTPEQVHHDLLELHEREIAARGKTVAR